MTLAKAEHDRLAKLPQADKNTSIQNDVDTIHRCVNSGTVDRDAVNTALERIAACIEKTPAPVGTPKPLGTVAPQPATYRAPGVTDQQAHPQT